MLSYAQHAIINVEAVQSYQQTVRAAVLLFIEL